MRRQGDLPKAETVSGTACRCLKRVAGQTSLALRQHDAQACQEVIQAIVFLKPTPGHTAIAFGVRQRISRLRSSGKDFPTFGCLQVC